MRVLLQRVSYASVTVADQVVGQIERGLLLFIGVAPDDTDQQAQTLVEKIIHLRIFADQQGKMNLSLLDVQAEILAVSQFTLYADTRKGRRPSFVNAAPPDHANHLFELFKHSLSAHDITVASGIFGADMQVDLRNDGPVTIWLDTSQP